MLDANELKAALERLIAGTASEADGNTLRTALTTGNLLTGERAVTIGGNASNVTIITGDQKIVFSLDGADPVAVKAALDSITPTRRHQMPTPPADFIGRAAEQQELRAAIVHNGVTISCLQGMGGIGKTVLALKLAEQLKSHYPDAQIYLDLKGTTSQPLTAAEALAHVIHSYHPAEALPDNESELRGRYLSVLEGQRALLLMDNAASATQVEPLIPPSSCILLVTSRRHFTLPGMAVKNLDVLTGADACSLLLTIAPRISESADQIAKLCGYLPLALRLSASALAKYINLSPSDYVQRLRNAQQRLQLIDASLTLSYELLSDELKEHWRQLAVFPGSFADDAAAAVWQVETEQAQNTLGELLIASMVEWNENASRYQLHELARLFGESRVSHAERVDGHKRHASHYLEVLAAADRFYLQGGELAFRGLTLFDREWSNIEAGHDWVAAHADLADPEVARLSMAYPDAGMDILYLRRPSRERIRWLEIALAAARLLRNREIEGVTLGNLGLAYDELGQSRRAIQAYEQALIIHRELGDRRSEGVGLANIGIAYRKLGEILKAIDCHAKALNLQRELGDRRGEAADLGNLGNAYASLGENDRAIHSYEQALRIYHELSDRRGQTNSLGNLGLVYANLGQPRRAIELYEQALLIDREIGDRLGEGTDLWNMSKALDQLGKRTEAIQCAEQALIIKEEIEDPYASIVRVQLTEWRKSLHG